MISKLIKNIKSKPYFYINSSILVGLLVCMAVLLNKKYTIEGVRNMNCCGGINPGVHYIEVRDDYNDLEEKLEYYSSHPKEAEEIIGQSTAYCQQFMNRREEDLIAFLVLEKFFHYSGQINSVFF